MFATHETFKFSLQVDDEYTLWRGVELMLNSPWLLAVVEDEKLAYRTFLLKGVDELLPMAQSSALGELISVRLVLPPESSMTGEWAFKAIHRIERETTRRHARIPGAVLVDGEGGRYGGFPLGPIECQAQDLVLIQKLPIASSMEIGAAP